MPYIDVEKRELLEHSLQNLYARILVQNEADLAGVLNYCISRIVSEIVKEKGLKYSQLNELIGVLECAKLELYRRVAAPYEDEKAILNGDVF
jgi:hypothetical protein|tara:strand:- start:3623 stop:3898 length:276 start_codon:yes stop_codon:yes gene_type:complete